LELLTERAVEELDISIAKLGEWGGRSGVDSESAAG
jgi:hypothetical protein